VSVAENSEPRRVFYAASVHDESEIEAVVEVLRDPRGLWVGRKVGAMERAVAPLFGKHSGVMVNSGSSALYLAIELLGAQPGDEIIGSAVTFSTDISPIVRAGLVPVFVDVEPDTYVVDIDRIGAMITDRTRALLLPNLIGNVPDWDAIRRIADRHGILLIEDSCDALGATLRGTPTGARSDFSVTSFASSHIITCAGGGGMLLLNHEADRDRALLLRRWGRRSELHFFGSKRRDHDYWEDLDGIHYDNQFIFDELAWNFEPSELGAAFGLEQLKKLPTTTRAGSGISTSTRSSSRAMSTTSSCRGSCPRSTRPGSATPSPSGPMSGSGGRTCSSTSTSTGWTPGRSGPETPHGSRCSAASLCGHQRTGYPSPIRLWSTDSSCPPTTG
jgi:dTDP-4-amino-4,6-dideoxygalactose transaminase